MKACVIGFAGHSILAFSIDILISIIVSFRSCSTSDSHVSLWNLVTSALPWYWSSRALLGSSFLFSHVSSMSEIFFSIFAILSLICLCLSPLSSLIFAMVEFIPWSWDPTESFIVCTRSSSRATFEYCRNTKFLGRSHRVSWLNPADFEQWFQRCLFHEPSSMTNQRMLQKNKEAATYQEPFSRGNSCQTNASNKKRAWI